MKSIQTKILTVVISGLLVITALVSIIAVSMTHEIMHKDADRILNNVTLKEAAYINDVLGDVSKSCHIMERYAIEKIDSAWQLKDETFREEYVKSTETMFEEIALNTSRVEGFFLRLNPRFTNGTTGYYNLVVGDSFVRAMNVTDLTKYDENDEQNVSWYYTPVRAGEPVWLKPYRFPGHDKLLISYAAPLYVDAQLVGVLGIDMDFEALVEYVNDISVYDNGYAVLLASDGETIYNEVEHESSTEPHTKATTALKNGMYLELRAEYKDIQKDIHPLLTQIVLAFVAVLVAAVIYTIAVTRKIVEPLKRLTAAAEGLALGKGSSGIDEVPVESKDEIGTLSRVLKSTYEKISEYTAYINALAYRDSLTGIKNSTAYAEAVAEMNKEINCANASFGVLVADINNLKKTNDRYGHDVGNELIIHTAKILADIFRTSPVFRIGGDEFAVILKGKDYESYHSLLSKLDAACAEDFITVMEDKFPVAIARGVALFDPEIDKVYEDVFAKADHAMYLHKEQSKTTVTE